jgi:hypothetical protein
VVLFDTARRRVNARLLDAGGGVRMTDGTEVRLRGRVTFWDRGGRLQLQMSDIDPSFTLGRLADDRARLLRALAAEGLLERQAALTRPSVPLRLGLVTSAGSAAEHDVPTSLPGRASAPVLRADVRPGTRARFGGVGLRAVAPRGVDVVLLVRGRATTESRRADSEGIGRGGGGPSSPCSQGSATTSTARWPTRWPTPATRRPRPAQAVVADAGVQQRTIAARGRSAGSPAPRPPEAERLRACGQHVAVATARVWRPPTATMTRGAGWSVTLARPTAGSTGPWPTSRRAGVSTCATHEATRFASGCRQPRRWRWRPAGSTV